MALERRAAPGAPWQREHRCCRAPDGTRLAYRVSGAGPLVVTVGAFASHLALDHEHPVLRTALDALHREFTVLRYDERGHGLSPCDRGDDDLATRVQDLRTVVDAAGFDRFAILAMHMGGPVGITFTALHPDRVTRLVLGATFATGPALLGGHVTASLLFARLIGEGWGRRSPYRRVLSTGILPGASEGMLAWLDEAQPSLGTPEAMAASYWHQTTADASAYLTRVEAPTLVLHARDDLLVDVAEARRVAAAIPGARLVTFADGGNVVPEHEEHWESAVSAVTTLVSGRPPSPPFVTAGLGSLTAREQHVLRLMAAGGSNAQIAAREFLSVRTVERHVSTIYRKLGLTGPASRTRAVAAYLRQGGVLDGPP